MHGRNIRNEQVKYERTKKEEKADNAMNMGNKKKIKIRLENRRIGKRDKEKERVTF